MQILIGEIKRKMKKKKISIYGSRFDEEMSEIGRFGGLGLGVNEMKYAMHENMVLMWCSLCLNNQY